MMSIVAGVQEYIQAMVDRVSGMKVLILDAETVGMISMVYSQSDILQHEVFLTERIDVENKDKMRHMNAICFLRPTSQNFILLTKMLKSPNYNEYHIFFTNAVPHMRLEQLACCDEFEVVHQVQEFFADVYAITHDLFSLNLQSTMKLHEDRMQWTSYEESVFERILEGLLAACLNLRVLPLIRYTSSSPLASVIGARLQARITEELSLFETFEKDRRKDAMPILLLIDRRNDPVTPLLNQWTYQAMLHELLNIENNRIDMSRVPGVRPELKEIVMSTTQDQFFEENLVANFGDLGINVKKLVEDYQAATQNTAKIESIQEMQRFVDEYPEFRKQSGNVSKHVAVVHELSRIVDANGLLEASQLEQEIACTENRQEQFRTLLELLRSQKITNMERLRLVLLYALRYETDSSGIMTLKDMLKSKGIGEDQVCLIDQLLRYAGAHARSGDLFQNKSFLAQAKSAIATNFKGVENVYTQHKTQLVSVVEKLMKGKLQETTFPYADGCRYANPSKEPPPKAIVFVVGGCTYEESRDISELNKTLGGRCVVLGGTTIHNSRSFLADVAQLGAQRGYD
eukprot:TRINITY_DN111837_c0_g1_i1.p1 TRINITY_DN111837_c0_g1~~TRINITY_DN111837_c0_g1_i1.p1  ORF type:complete len:572 (-),score=138.12 TRINITY_DN111837_c0_g1_i1:277-1992(-)